MDKTTAGTMGTIRETLAHLVGADAGYQSRMHMDPSRRIADPDSLTLSELREIFIEKSKGWQAVLDDLGGYDPAIEAHDDFPRIAHARNLLLTQALHHGNDHRHAHLRRIGRQWARDPLDGCLGLLGRGAGLDPGRSAFVRATHASPTLSTRYVCPTRCSDSP